MKSTVLLLTILSLFGCTSPTATPQPPVQDTLIRATNFNGKGGIEIEGYRWTSQNDAKGNGLMLRDVENRSTNLRPKPAVDEDTQAMLNSSIAQAGTLTINQVMYGAQYEMYFWFMENERGAQRTMSVEIEEERFDDPIGNLPYKHWSRFGPYPVDLSDGELNIVLTTADPKQNAEVMGMLLVKPE